MKFQKLKQTFLFLLVVIMMGSWLSCKKERTGNYFFKIKPIKNTVMNNHSAILLATTLTNNTNDTLKFLNMSCMWSVIYNCDSKQVHVIGPEKCDKNDLTVIKVNPHETLEKEFYVMLNQTKVDQKVSFRLSIDLIHYEDPKDLQEFDIFIKARKGEKAKNTVLSNIILVDQKAS